MCEEARVLCLWMFAAAAGQCRNKLIGSPVEGIEPNAVFLRINDGPAKDQIDQWWSNMLQAVKVQLAFHTKMSNTKLVYCDAPTLRVEKSLNTPFALL